MTTETVFWQTLALWLGNGDEHRALELDTSGLNIKGNLYLCLNAVKNWSVPGPDELHRFWLKDLTSLHQLIALQFNHLFQYSTTEDWMTTDCTFLILKDHQKGNKLSSSQPSTCLPITFKLLTGVLARSIYNYLPENSLYPIEQKGKFNKSRGTKDLPTPQTWSCLLIKWSWRMQKDKKQSLIWPG